MNKAKAIFAYGWVTVVILALLAFLVTAHAPGIVHAAAIGAAFLLILLCVKVVQMEDGVETGAVISFFGRPYRTVGSGLVLLFQPLGIPIERIAKTVLLRECVIDDKMNAETEDEEVVSLDFSIEYLPVVVLLLQFLKFGKDQVESAIKQRVKSLLSIEVRKRKDRDEVYDQLATITATVRDEFNRLYREQYGVVIRFMIDDPELPKELAEAEVKREIQEKENERRGIEMRKLKTMANQLVRAEEKRGNKLTLDQAMKRLQVQFKIVEEKYNHNVESKTHDVGNNVIGAIEKIAPIFIKKSGRRQSNH